MRHNFACAATGLLAAAIAWLTLSHPTQGPPGPVSDKVYHFIAFAALVFPTALLYLRSLFWVLPGALLFGGAIDLVQPTVGRSGETADFVADLFGITFGLTGGLTIRSIRSKRVNPGSLIENEVSDFRRL